MAGECIYHYPNKKSCSYFVVEGIAELYSPVSTSLVHDFIFSNQMIHLPNRNHQHTSIRASSLKGLTVWEFTSINAEDEASICAMVKSERLLLAQGSPPSFEFAETLNSLDFISQCKLNLLNVTLNSRSNHLFPPQLPIFKPFSPSVVQEIVRGAEVLPLHQNSPLCLNNFYLIIHGMIFVRISN